MAIQKHIPLIGHEEQLRDWLKLGDHRHPDDPSLHDLLDLDESCLDRQKIKARSIERARTLHDLQPTTRDAATQKLLAHVGRYISSADAYLCDPEPSKEYFAQLKEYRKARLLKYLKRHCDPEETISPQVHGELVKLGRYRFRLAKVAVEETRSEFFQSEKVQVPGPYRNLVKRLKICVFPEDPMWPTHFDVLGLPDSQPVDAGAVKRACDDQIAKLAKALRHPSLDKQREAKAVLQRVESAARELGANASSYIKTCLKTRVSKFTDMVNEHKRLRGELAADGRARLFREAGRVRLPQSEAVSVIDWVFPSWQEPHARKPGRTAGGSGTAGSGSAGGGTTGSTASTQPHVQRPALERYGSAAALIGTVALLATLLSQYFAPHETSPLVVGIAGGCASLVGLGILGSLWGENWMDLKGLAGAYGKLLVVAGLLLLASYLVGDGIAGVFGLLSRPLAAPLTSAAFGAAAGLFTGAFVLSEACGEDSAVVTRTLVPACAGGFFLADFLSGVLLQCPYVLPCWSRSL